jgi:phage tail tape-measure protein
VTSDEFGGKRQMKKEFKHMIDNVPSKGGLIGALIGALASAKYHKRGDRPIRNAGKTALFSGVGFLLGQWIEKHLPGRRDKVQGTG